MPIDNHVTITTNPSDLTAQDPKSLDVIFSDWVTIELQKVIPTSTNKIRTVLRKSAAPSSSISDDLARIEHEAQTLTKKLLDLGLRPQVAAEAVVTQFRFPLYEELPHVKGLRDQARLDRRLAPRGGGTQKAASAGACLAIADWLDEGGRI